MINSSKAKELPVIICLSKKVNTNDIRRLRKHGNKTDIVTTATFKLPGTLLLLCQLVYS